MGAPFPPVLFQDLWDKMNMNEIAVNKKLNYLKAGFTLLIAIYGIICVRDVTEYRFLDRVDLVAHEAGHLLFSYFGQFIMIAGGTIGQLFVPVAITIYFIARQEFYSSCVTIFWIGQNMFNISVYVKDARAMELPLVTVGGGDAMHDWNYMLSRLGILNLDQIAGNMVYGLGVLIMLAAVVIGFYFSLEIDDSEERFNARQA